MNYYPRYPGDYLAKTLDLTMVEDGAYNRLIDWYYSNEQPIPHARRHVIARASTASERSAVDAVLAKFFERDGDVYHHRRIDEEIAKAVPRIQAAKANGSKGGRRPRNPGGGQEPPDDPSKNPPGNPPGFLNGNLNGTHRVTHGASSPEPYPERNTEDESEQRARASVTGFVPTPAGSVCRAMRTAGMDAVNPGDPRLLALLEQGATEAEFVGITTEAVKGGKGWAWVLAVVERRRADAAVIALAPRVAAAEPEWRAEQRARTRAFAGPAAAKGAPETIDMETADAPHRLG